MSDPPVENPPEIPDLTFRNYRGDEDLPGILEVGKRSRAADGIEMAMTVEDLRGIYADAKNCDPVQDLLIVEVAGEMVAYSRLFWVEDHDGCHNYLHQAYVVPEHRGTGLYQTILEWNESRIRRVAAEHHPEVSKSFSARWEAGEEIWGRTLAENGYSIKRDEWYMVRSLDTVPISASPPGYALRIAIQDDGRAIWDLNTLTLRDLPGISARTEEDFVKWFSSPVFQPDLWVVVELDEELVGFFLSHIPPKEQERPDRTRAYSDELGVKRGHRRKGLARAMLLAGWDLMKAAGATEASLHVDAHSPSCAHELCLSLGYRVEHEIKAVSKPL